MGRGSQSRRNGGSAVGPEEDGANGGEGGEVGESLIRQSLSFYLDAVLFSRWRNWPSPILGKVRELCQS